MEFRKKAFYGVINISFFILSIVSVIVELCTVVIIGFVIGMITNHYPGWANFKVTRFFDSLINPYFNFGEKPNLSFLK